MLNDKYSTSPGTAITPIEANKILAETFPSVLHKRMTRGGVKSTFLVGVSMATSMHSTSSSSTDQEKQQLMQRISELEEEVAQQKLEISSLKKCEHLVDQAENAMSLAPISSNGPDLSDFSVDTIIGELSECSPDLYQVFQLVGNTARSSNKYGELNLSVEEMKVVMSLCTILNARCNRFNGMQLLLSFMLIARGTSKQVYTPEGIICTCSYTYTFYSHLYMNSSHPAKEMTPQRS